MPAVLGRPKPRLGETPAKTIPATDAVPAEAAQPAATDDEVGEEAELATSTAEAPTVAPQGLADDEDYVWPEGAEQMQGSDTAGGDESPARGNPEAPVPSVDELAKRIPVDVKETLEDLFRAKFVSAKRVSAKTLKMLPKKEASA